MRTVLMFGTFDGVHEGHKHAFQEARVHGERLVIALAQDVVVRKIKGRAPKRTFAIRCQELLETGLVDAVVKGDDIQGSYGVLDRVDPQTIALGYDQKALSENLLAFLHEKGKSIAVITLKPFEPEMYKSSLLNKDV